MFKRMIALVAVVAFAVAAFAVANPKAQAQGDTVVCDSTLVTLLYVAESEYGFKAMSTDVSKLEKGQFKGLFEAMMANMMEGTPEAMMEGTPEAMMGTPEAMMDAMVKLTPGVVAGENEACTALRAEIEAFLFEKFSAGMMMK
jgi:hypothetical protein